ncbi:hypothetical protein GGU11DRAFT_674742 [Lentinula aff. detonsa]|nr:hypothetical protein GGU11DRAFT_674742 [Lentinula aff. detonsa]
MGIEEVTAEGAWDLAFNWAWEDWVFPEVESTIRTKRRKCHIRGATIGRSWTCEFRLISLSRTPYSRRRLFRDVWECLFYHQICESLTWHVFEVPPTKVLDIGCGTGSWILDCARAWRKCHFVGLDIVPIQPDLQQVGSADSHRVTWVQGNFLEGLPFPNEEFDFVHIKRISLGVPEDKWDFLFEEISRVMKPGAAFEMIEEDLMFPGSLIRLDDENDSIPEDSSGSRRTSFVGERIGTSDEPFVSSSADQAATGTSPHPMPSHSHLQHPTDSTITPSRIQRPLIDTASVTVPSKSTLLRHPLSASTGSLTDLRSASLYNSNPYAKLNSVASGNSLPPKRPLSASNHGFVTNSSIHLPSMSFSQSVHSLSSNSPRSPIMVAEMNNGSRTISSSSKLTSGGPAAPFLLRTLLKPPLNPRDHSMLELIYNEMNAARFVNLSPLSLLPNLLGLYFKDLRTHPPVIFTFPPIPVAQDAIRPSPPPSAVTNPARGRSMSSASNGSSRITGSPTPSSARTTYFEGVHDHWINIQQIVKRESPYIIYDGSRLSALSPSARASMLFSKEQPHKPAHDVRFRLPNTTMNIDLRSLNLHLALRVTEILACSETMWEWVLEHQEQARNRKYLQESKARSRSQSIGPAHPSSRNNQQSVQESSDDRLKAVLAELTREEYDDMLRRFYLDMQDCMALPAVLEERFGWTTSPAPPPAERKTFEAECEKFQQWEAEQRQKNNSKFSSGQGSRQRTNSTAFPSPVSALNFSPILDGLPASHGMKSSTNGHHSVSSNSVKSQQDAQSVSSAAPPSKRLSRSLRIFVAWKGFDVSEMKSP